MTSVRRTLPPTDSPTLFTLESLNFNHGAAPVPAQSSRWRRSRARWQNHHLLEGSTLVRPYDIPLMSRCDHVPEKLVAFSEVRSAVSLSGQQWVHFYEEDLRFEGIWSAPERYLPMLRKAGGVIAPDFSVYRNMPFAEKVHNTYRNFLLGAWLQREGLNVIPNVRLSGQTSTSWALAGVPNRSTLAVGLHGCTRDVENRAHVKREIRLLCDEKRPANLVVYGSSAYGVLDYPQEIGIPVHEFRPDSHTRSVTRKDVA